MKNFIKYLILNNKILNGIVTYIYHKLWLFDIYRGFSIPFSLLIRNVNIRLFPEGQVAKILFMKKFEQVEIDFFSRLIKPGMTVVDAGANIGLYSLIASKLVGDKGHVYAFEPSVETYQRLLKNIQLNHSKNIYPNNLGLGDNIDQELKLRQDVGFEDAERYLVPANFEVNSELSNVNSIEKEESIKITMLDDFLEKSGVESVDFLKIDTEGFEYYILNGARKILKSSDKMIILFECTELGTQRSNTSQKAVFDILNELGFNLYYWNIQEKKFCSDLEGCYSSGELWACRSEAQLSDLIC